MQETNNVFDAKSLFAKRRHEVLTEATYDKLMRYISSYRCFVGAGVTAEAIYEFRNILSSLPDHAVERVCAILVFTELYFYNRSVSEEDGSVKAVYSVTDLVFDLGEMLSLDETEEGNLSSSVMTIVEMETTADESATVSMDMDVPWSDDATLSVGVASDDREEEIIDLTMPKADRVKELRTAFTTVFVAFEKAFWSIGLDPVDCEIATRKKHRHLVHACRVANKTVVLLLNVEEILRLEDLFREYLQEKESK